MQNFDKPSVGTFDMMWYAEEYLRLSGTAKTNEMEKSYQKFQTCALFKIL